VRTLHWGRLAFARAPPARHAPARLHTLLIFKKA
jgi:hypothetical protein